MGHRSRPDLPGHRQYQSSGRHRTNYPLRRHPRAKSVRLTAGGASTVLIGNCKKSTAAPPGPFVPVPVPKAATGFILTTSLEPLTSPGNMPSAAFTTWCRTKSSRQKNSLTASAMRTICPLSPGTPPAPANAPTTCESLIKNLKPPATRSSTPALTSNEFPLIRVDADLTYPPSPSLPLFLSPSLLLSLSSSLPLSLSPPLPTLPPSTPVRRKPNQRYAILILPAHPPFFRAGTG